MLLDTIIMITMFLYIWQAGSADCIQLSKFNSNLRAGKPLFLTTMTQTEHLFLSNALDHNPVNVRGEATKKSEYRVLLDPIIMITMFLYIWQAGSADCIQLSKFNSNLRAGKPLFLTTMTQTEHLFLSNALDHNPVNVRGDCFGMVGFRDMIVWNHFVCKCFSGQWFNIDMTGYKLCLMWFNAAIEYSDGIECTLTELSTQSTVDLSGSLYRTCSFMNAAGYSVDAVDVRLLLLAFIKSVQLEVDSTVAPYPIAPFASSPMVPMPDKYMPQQDCEEYCSAATARCLNRHTKLRAYADVLTPLPAVQIFGTMWVFDLNLTPDMLQIDHFNAQVVTNCHCSPHILGCESYDSIGVGSSNLKANMSDVAFLLAICAAHALGLSTVDATTAFHSTLLTSDKVVYHDNYPPCSLDFCLDSAGQSKFEKLNTALEGTCAIISEFWFVPFVAAFWRSADPPEEDGIMHINVFDFLAYSHSRIGNCLDKFYGYYYARPYGPALKSVWLSTTRNQELPQVFLSPGLLLPRLSQQDHKVVVFCNSVQDDIRYIPSENYWAQLQPFSTVYDVKMSWFCTAYSLVVSGILLVTSLQISLIYFLHKLGPQLPSCATHSSSLSTLSRFYPCESYCSSPILLGWYGGSPLARWKLDRAEFAVHF